MSKLLRRIPRDFIHNLGKYLGLLLLMSFATAFTSGFLQSAASIKDLASEMRETYHVEDFFITTMYEMDDNDIKAIENLGATVYENFSRDLDLDLKGNDQDITVRTFRLRDGSFNGAAYAEGRAPEAPGEIALDRVFCANHALKLGDTVTVEGEPFELVGIMTLADHTVTYKSSSDFMFNAVTHTVAQVCDEDFDRLIGDAAIFSYSVLLDDRELSTHERINFEEDVVDTLVDRDVSVTDLVDSESNIGLTFAADDVEGDMFMWEVLMLLLIVIMAFVFVVLSDATIEQESAVIGTLLASGYRKREIIAHYMILPIVIGLLGVVIGNVIGCTLLTRPMQGLYYNSYSFPPFVMRWHWDIFALTSLLPFALLVIITWLGLVRKLGATPLQFLRHEASRKARKGGISLPQFLSYPSRFRLRVFARNASHFATLFLGIMFGSILLLLGLVLLPIVEYNANLMANDVPAEHLYMLKTPLVIDASEEERRAWAAAEELATNPAYDVLDLDLLEDLGDQLEKLGLSFDSFDDEDSSFTLPASVEEAIEASVDEETDFSDPQLLGMVRQFAAMADIDLEGASDAELQRLLETADSFHKQIHELDDEHMDEVEALLEDIMEVDELPEDPVNQSAIANSTLDQVERFAMASLSLARRMSDSVEEITIYGIPENSRYWTDLNVSGDAILVGEGVLQKCAIELGEPAEFIDRFANESYEISPTAACGNGTTMSIYMSLAHFNELFGNDADYFNAFASNDELALDARYVATEITPDRMLSMSEQMQDSMGDVMKMMIGMVIPIYLILIYLLTKTVIDRSARSISYMKVFGYRDREIDGLYVRAISITVIASLILCLPLIVAFIDWLVPIMLARYSGNFVMNYPPEYMWRIVGIGLLTYAAVAALHLARIRRIPLSLAMRVQE